MATDGQGVILAVPHSVDPRQRAVIDLLSRRVSRRLGCPTAAGQMQRGTLYVDAPLEDLHAKGAREVVVAPLTLSDQRFEYSTPASRSSAGLRLGSVTFRNAGSLGGAPEVVDAVLESLENSERDPDPSTRVVLVLPFHEQSAQPELEQHLERFGAAGWKDGAVYTMPPNGTKPDMSRVLNSSTSGSALLVPLVVTSGPFCDRVAKCASDYGLDMAYAAFHSSVALTGLICRRVVDARRS
jgi:sirohydrochlorin ferrochelatase